MTDIISLIVALIIILIAAEFFTNGIEWLGQKLQLSEGVIGSVLAAVGTALPETLIPFVAVICFGTKHGQEVGIGAIAGAPFMLSTLTLAVCGFAVWFFAQLGHRRHELTFNRAVICRDLRFFITAYSLALLATLLSDQLARYFVAAIILLIYPFYLHKTFMHGGEVGQAPEHLHLERIFKTGSVRLWSIILQILFGFAGILCGAFMFVDRIDDLALAIGMPTLVLSLIIAPVATELPEKVNSVLWARNGKDTLALGNISGALVFQSCFPVAFGVAFTTWKLTTGTICSGLIAIVSAAIVLKLSESGNLKATYLMVGSLVYMATIACLWLANATAH